MWIRGLIRHGLDACMDAFGIVQAVPALRGGNHQGRGLPPPRMQPLPHQVLLEVRSHFRFCSAGSMVLFSSLLCWRYCFIFSFCWKHDSIEDYGNAGTPSHGSCVFAKWQDRMSAPPAPFSSASCQHISASDIRPLGRGHSVIVWFCIGPQDY